MRRRTLRPSSRAAIMLLVAAITIVLTIGWELGRLVVRLGGWRSIVALASGLTFFLFALGWGAK